MTPSTYLREQTAAAHEALEQLPFSQALAAGNIDERTYVEYLRATSVLVANLRTDIRKHGLELHQEMQATFSDWASKLEADVLALGGDDGLANEEALNAVHRLVHTMRCNLMENPAWVLGLAYVLFGSHQGHRVIAPKVMRSLGARAEAGTSYLRASMQGPPLWPRFKNSLDQWLQDESHQAVALQGALATFSGFQEIFKALEAENVLLPHAAALNPEAGEHEVAENRQLRTIAADAGTECHLAFGYLVLRYGDRGEAFARSDGAWLITLCEQPYERARERLDWLARMLSARGIPSACLEHKLEVLHRELSKADLLTATTKHCLEQYLEQIRARYQSIIAKETQQQLESTSLPVIEPRGARALLSAIIDQVSSLAPCADRVGIWIQTTNLITPPERDQLMEFMLEARDTCIAR